MKKQAILAGLALLVLIPVIAATTYYGISVSGSSFILNPANVLDTDYDYATLQYATNITCPLGNFYKSPTYPNYFCVHNGTGLVIGGWEVVEFNTTWVNITKITVKASELNLGCTTCNVGVDVQVFSAGTTYDSNTQWTYRGTCSFPDNANMTECNLNFSVTNVGHVLIGRWGGGNFRPDPAVHLVTIGN